MEPETHSKHDSKTNVEMKKTENMQDSQVFIGEKQSSTISEHLGIRDYRRVTAEQANRIDFLMKGSKVCLIYLHGKKKKNQVCFYNVKMHCSCQA